jgi:hypothetical protein
MGRQARYILTAIGILGLGILIILIHPIERYQRARCGEILKLLGNAVQTYQGDHQGQLPRQLAALSIELSNPAFLICPGSGHAPGSFTNADSWTDYTFIDWSAKYGTSAVPKDYPIAYDCSLRNHADRGVNVLTLDGVVRWDADARWLKKFASEHRDARLTLPQEGKEAMDQKGNAPGEKAIGFK